MNLPPDAVIEERLTRNKEDMIQYQFKINRDLWREWKLTVRRDKSLDERIIELLTEDLRTKQ